MTPLEMASIADRYAREALEALRLARWCYEHRSTLFFCEHRHAEEIRP